MNQFNFLNLSNVNDFNFLKPIQTTHFIAESDLKEIENVVFSRVDIMNLERWEPRLQAQMSLLDYYMQVCPSYSDKSIFNRVYELLQGHFEPTFVNHQSLYYEIYKFYTNEKFTIFQFIPKPELKDFKEHIDLMLDNMEKICNDRKNVLEFTNILEYLTDFSNLANNPLMQAIFLLKNAKIDAPKEKEHFTKIVKTQLEKWLNEYLEEFSYIQSTIESVYPFYCTNIKKAIEFMWKNCFNPTFVNNSNIPEVFTEQIDKIKNKMPMFYSTIDMQSIIWSAIYWYEFNTINHVYNKSYFFCIGDSEFDKFKNILEYFKKEIEKGHFILS